jgi:hypothetical protein
VKGLQGELERSGGEIGEHCYCDAVEAEEVVAEVGG